MNIDKTVFIADGAQVAGDKVTVGAGSSIWYNAVIRNTGGEEVVIGKDTNIQDLCMVHNGKLSMKLPATAWKICMNILQTLTLM